HVEAAARELERQVSLAAAEFEHARPTCHGALEKVPLFRPEEDLLQHRIVPDLRVLGIPGDTAPVLGFGPRELLIACVHSCSSRGSETTSRARPGAGEIQARPIRAPACGQCPVPEIRWRSLSPP